MLVTCKNKLWSKCCAQILFTILLCFEESHIAACLISAERRYALRWHCKLWTCRNAGFFLLNKSPSKWLHHAKRIPPMLDIYLIKQKASPPNRWTIPKHCSLIKRLLCWFAMIAMWDVDSFVTYMPDWNAWFLRFQFSLCFISDSLLQILWHLWRLLQSPAWARAWAQQQSQHLGSDGAGAVGLERRAQSAWMEHCIGRSTHRQPQQRRQP